MAGYVDRDNGLWKIKAGSYDAVTPLILSEEDLVGPVQTVLRTSMRDAANGVKGVYISQEENWDAADFPPYIGRAKSPTGAATINTSANTISQESAGIIDGDRVKLFNFPSGGLPGGTAQGLFYYAVNSTETTFQIATSLGGTPVNLITTGSNVYTWFDPFLTEDGERIWMDVEMAGVINPYQAQRLAKIQLLRSRFDLQLVAPFNFAAFQYAVGDVLPVINNKLGLLGLEGSPSAVTIDAANDKILHGSHPFNNGDPIAFTSQEAGQKSVQRSIIGSSTSQPTLTRFLESRAANLLSCNPAQARLTCARACCSRC
jgi:hypothetical protein